MPTRKQARRTARQRRAALLAERRALVARAEAEACPRCHREPCVDPHELVRRSQHRGGIVDWEIVVPVGRACHDWITGHPVAAHDAGWVLWRWELDDLEARARAGRLRLEASIGITARPDATVRDMTSQRVLVTLSEEMLARVDALAEAERRPRTSMLALLVEDGLAHRDLDGAATGPTADEVYDRQVQQAAPRGRTLMGRPFGPVPK